MTAVQTENPRNGRSTFINEVSPSMYEIVARGGPDAVDPAISVIVPAFNRAKLLAHTIDALFHQDLNDSRYEVIVVDNASEDRTTNVLAEKASASDIPFTGVHMRENRGPAVSRNVGVSLARGEIIAFTDSDCVPTPQWLRSAAEAMSDAVGVVQGRTRANPEQRQPLFNHFIDTRRFDGSFSTSNVCYRREAIIDAGGFDPGCKYWEDVDLGWRVRRRGWQAIFAAEAVVHHQVIQLSPMQWLKHATNFSNWPAKAARYPEFRRHLFAGLWTDKWNAAFQAALVGAFLGIRWRPFLLLTLPYLASFPSRGRLSGRWPALRATASITRDLVSFSALVAGSIRHRSPVL